MLNAIGIDFGTNYCRKAYLNEGDQPLIPNDLGEVTPAWVSFSPDGKSIVGRESKVEHYSPTKIPLTQIKSRLATRDALWSGKKMHTPAEIACWLFKALRRDAEDLLAKPVTGAVVAVPALAGNLQRATTREAVQQAGLTTMKFIGEPTAAVMAHHRLNRRDRCTLVYSLGAGYFEVAVIEREGQRFKTLGLEGDKQIGGNAFDRQIRDYVLAQLFKTYRVDLRTNSALLWRLADLIEAAKIELSSQNQTNIVIQNQEQRTERHPKTLTLSLTRSKVEDLLRESIEQTLLLVQQALNVANVSRHDIDEILLVGGSTQIPLIQNRLREQFHKELVPTSDGIIAQGAALQTAYLQAKERHPSTFWTPAKPIPAEDESTSAAEEVFEPIMDQNTVDIVYLPHQVRGANSFFTHFSQKMNLKIGVFFLNRFLRSTWEHSSELLQAEPNDQIFSSLERIKQNIQELLAEKYFIEGSLKKAELITKSAQNILSYNELTSAIELMERGLTNNRHHKRMRREVRHLYQHHAELLFNERKGQDLLDLIQRSQDYGIDGTWTKNYRMAGYYFYAKSLANEGQWQEAIEYFEKVLKSYPQEESIRPIIVDCSVRLGQKLYDESQLQKALFYFKMAQIHNFEHEDEVIRQGIVDCYMKLGQIYYYNNKFYKSLSYFKRAQIHDPKDQEINECINHLRSKLAY